MANATTQVRTVYLVRHAIAEERGGQWPDDTKRPLTRDGTRKMRRIVRGLVTLDVEVDLILTSPLVRARQTAALLARGLQPHPDVASLSELEPGGAPGRTARALDRFAGAGSLMLVGHEPDLGLLAGWLIGSKSPVPFRKGAVCRIDLRAWPPDQTGSLIWFAMPRMLRRIGGRG